MFRSLIAAAVVYAYGHPAFDGYRPSILDKPLQGFYGDVNIAARNGRNVLASFDGARAVSYLNYYVQRIDTELRSNK